MAVPVTEAVAEFPAATMVREGVPVVDTVAVLEGVLDDVADNVLV